MENTYYIMTFYSVHLALSFEKAMKSRNYGVQIIPVPRKISSSCGLCGKFEISPEAVMILAEEEGIDYEDIYETDGKTRFTQLTDHSEHHN